MIAIHLYLSTITRNPQTVHKVQKSKPAKWSTISTNSQVTTKSRATGNIAKGTPFSSRYAAAETLVRLQQSKLPLKPLFDSVTLEYQITGAERGLAMNLVYGVLRRREYLNHLLSLLARKPFQQLEPFIHATLLVGLYQLFCLDRIPESAAVNEAVNAVKKARPGSHLHGFVNGVLRSATRQKEQLPGPQDRYPDRRPFLNHPGWLTKRWIKQYGRQEMERICAVNSLEPQLVLRVNTGTVSKEHYLKQLNQLGINATSGSYAPDSVVLWDFQGAVTALPGYQEGYFQVQDEAAQLATLLLAPFKESGSYLDCCAGLGGKTGHICQLTQNTTEVVAVEPEKHRQNLFHENMVRLFPDRNVALYPMPLEQFARDSESKFSGVLIDAPCSGTGVIGRHPDIRWNRKKSDFKRYQQTQSKLIELASQLVAEDGILVYATCSLEPEENRQVVDHFLLEHPEFVLCDCRDTLPEPAAKFIEDKCFCPRPSSSIDGFFAARMQRKN